MTEPGTEIDEIRIPELPELPQFPSIDLAKIREQWSLKRKLDACLIPLPILALRMLVMA